MIWNYRFFYISLQCLLTLICVFSNYNKLFYVTIKSSVCENRWFWEVTSELPLFLFMYCAVGFAIMVFICAQERYLPLGGISIHMKYFNALESKIYNKREVLIMVHPFQYIITINQQNTLMVSISGHSD